MAACCSWEDAQRARVACIDKYRAAKGHEQKKALLKDVLVLSFHTLQPPDRVGGERCTQPAHHKPSSSANTALAC